MAPCLMTALPPALLVLHDLFSAYAKALFRGPQHSCLKVGGRFGITEAIN
jgi:hypothetical protein